MAKDSKKDFKDRVKKSMPNNQWFINVGKSLGFTSMDVIKSLLPETSDTIDWNTDVVISAADMVKEIRNNNGVRNMFNRQLENLPQIKAAQQLRDNAFADLKSGRLYNKNRELGLNDDGEFNFDDFGDFGDDFSFIDDEGSDSESTDTSSNGGGRPPITVINTMPLAKTMVNAAEANMQTMVAIADQNMAIESEKLMLNRQTYDATMSALGSINDNLALLVQFNSDSTAKYQEAALKFFEESLEHMKAPKEEEEDSKKSIRDMLNPFTANGGLKLDEYGKVIKENLAKIKNENAELSTIVDFFGSPDVIEGFAKNPIGMLMSWGMSALVPKSIKSSLKDLDKNLNGILPSMLARLNSFENSDDPFLQLLNKTFGYKYKEVRSIDLGDYEKGTISWDGESKKALVEVIPSYLRRIESVLTGSEERIFNYDKGKFTDIATIEKDYKEKVADAKTSGFYSVRSESRDVVSQLGLSEKARKQVEKDLNKYFEVITEKGFAINPFSEKGNFGLDEFTEQMSEHYDYDTQRLDLVRRILKMLPKSTLKEMASTAITDSREKMYKLNEDTILNPNLSGYSYLYNDLDKDGKMRYNKKFIGDEKKDRFGLSQLDYLRDIRSALINGIRVFPDHRKRYKNGGGPNEGLLRKEKAEQEEFEKREEERKKAEELKAEDETLYGNDGRSIYDVANISDEDWNKIFKSRKKKKTGDKAVDFIDQVNEKVEDIELKLLFGDNNYRELAAEKIAGMYKRSKPVIKSVKGLFDDTVKAFKSYFTGQDYITSDGILVKGDEHASVFGSFKKIFTGIKDKFSSTDVENGGFLGRITKDFMDGFEKFKISLFGEKALSESKDSGKATFGNLMGKVKERLPKALAIGYGGALVKTAFASNLGILGNFLMPGGPLGTMLMGTTIGFLKQSETFNKYMFGEKDAEGNRVGGLISKAWQDKYQEHKDSIKKGAALGILGSLFLPGGPVAGAVIGIGTSLASKNEAFQEFLYGKDFKTQDKKSLMNGAFGKVMKNLSGGDDGDPALATFLGSTGLAVGIAQGVGLLPSMLLPGGPVMGAILGLAGGITASSNKFQEFLLGEKDVDGKRFGGILHRVTNWLDIKFMQPLKIKATEMADGVYGFLRKKIFDPLALAFEPVVHAAKNMILDVKDRIVDAFTSVTSPIVEAFKDYVVRPLGKVLKATLVNPLKKLLGGTFKLIGKTLLGIATLPLAGIGMLGKKADKYNARSEIRREKRRREKQYYKEHKGDNKWSRYYGSKMARRMTKEEEDALVQEKLKYRDGKTWKQRKAEQKGDFKDEMDKRKERREEMKRQYEEDKQFAKENKYKFGSKKQKERREEELKAKERWYQEQQLMQSQETDEKVSKIVDNVIEFPKQTDRVVDKLSDLQDTLRDGFNKLIGKSDNESKGDNVIPFHQGGDYGNVTKEDLDNIYRHTSDTPLSSGPKKYDPEKHNIIPFHKGGNYGKVTDDDIKKIDTYLDNETKKEMESKKEVPLKDPRDGFFKGKIIDITKKLQDNDQSHKDGLDMVPSDGYLAELHEGEMVVPKKPAGKLRGLMNKAGKGFKGLTDALSDVSEDDSREDEENGPVENALLQGTIKGLRGIAKGFRGMAGMMGKLVGGMSEDERRDREDNAMQLTDMEADRLKEMEDQERYEKVSRKNVDFIQDQIEQKEKEKADRNWKERLLAAVHGVGAATKNAGTNLFELLGKGLSFLKDGLGGLGSLLAALGLSAGVTSLMEVGDKYQESEEYIEGHTDADGSLVTDNYDLVKYRTMFSARNQIFLNPLKAVKKKVIDPIVGVGNKIKGNKFVQGITTKYKEKMGKLFPQAKEYLNGKKAAKTADNVIDFASAKAAKKGAGSTVKAGAKVTNIADAKLAKGAAESGSGKALSKMVGGAADEGGLVAKLVNAGKEALGKLASYVTEKFPKIGTSKIASGLLKCADSIFVKLLKFSDNILAKFAKKIAAVFTKIAAGASTAFILDAVFAVGDVLTGATAGNAGNLIGVSPENVDGRMRIISSIIQAVFNFNFMAIISLINEITNMMFNFNFLRSLAIWIYNLTGGKQDFGTRITPEQIDSCTSIEQALQIMGISDPQEIALLKNGNEWKDFSSVKNEELGGVITAAEQIELARLQYNLANGTKLNSQAFLDKTSKTFGTKVIDWGKKLFSTESADVKYNRLTTKASEKQAKANEYREKAKNTNNIFSKGWNNSMAWLNEKSAARAEKKAQKTVTKAATKKAKAEERLSYHQAQAEKSAGIKKWYHNWRANANQKKITKYTMTADGSVAPVDSEGNVVETGVGTNGEQAPIISPEMIRLNYPDMVEGDTIKDEYGNIYNHLGEVIYRAGMEGDAGMGEGEIYFSEAQTQITEKTRPKDSLLKKVGKTFLKFTPGGAALKAGAGLFSTLFGKNNKPEDYRMVPIMDEYGNIVSYQSQLIEDTTELEQFASENVSVQKLGSNTQVIPQVDEKGNVVSYATVEKNKSTGLFGRLKSAVGSFLGIGTTATVGGNTSNIDNSSSVTGDTYNTTTNEVDTSVFSPLTDAINKLTESYGNDNVDEEGNVKTGGVLQIIMDPMGYLGKKLLGYGVNIYEDTTGKDINDRDLNNSITLLNIIRNPFGYLLNVMGDKINSDDNGKQSDLIKWGKEKLDQGKEWGKEKWNQGVEWGKEKWNQGKEMLNGYYKDQYNKSDNVADVLMGDNKANPNLISTGISLGGSTIENIWNTFAGEDYKIEEGVIAGFVAKFLNGAIVKPFQELSGPVVEKFEEAKEAVGTWVNEKKEAIGNWWTEEIKKPLDESKERAKKTQQAIFDDVNARKEAITDWWTEKIKKPWDESKERAKKTQQAIFDDVTARKNAIMDWFKEKISEPFKTWAKRAGDRVIAIKEGIKGWIDGFKETIVEGFNKYIKEPVANAVKPVSDAVSGAWNSIKQSFQPIVNLFNEWKNNGIKGAIKALNSSGSDAYDEVNADEDNLRSGAKPGDNIKAIKPIQHNISSSELLKPINNTTNNSNTTNQTSNKFVFYSQSDARWSKTKIGNSNMKDAGCGPTSMAMAISQLTGEQITPDTVAKLGQEHLPGYSKYSLFPSIANKLNMNYVEGHDAGFISNNLRKGLPVILSGKTGISGTPFTSEGHVVTATHMMGNKVYINDPRGEAYSGYYPISSLMSGLTKGMVLTPSNRTDVSKLSSGSIDSLSTPEYMQKENLGIYGDTEEFDSLNAVKDMGKTGASQITIADRVLSYARAFLNNKDKFSYSQPRRLQIDTNKSSSKGCGADCSSFVSHVLSRAGDVDIYGNTSTTFWNNLGTKVSEPQIGDVVCQEGHVGLYSGNGNYIHMSGRKAGIKESKAIQNGNNRHRGYKRVLKNPAQMVDPTVPNPNSFLGTVVGTASGNPVGGGGGTTPTDGTTATAAPAVDTLGVFGKLQGIGTGLLASIYNGNDMFDAVMNGGTAPATDGTTPDIGNIPDTAQAVWTFFTGKGYSKNATAGIMGNLQQESTMDPTRKQSSGGPGRGIAQWTVSEGRFKGLEAHAKSKGKDWTDLQSQLEWIDMELGGKDSTTANILKKNYGGLEGFKKATDTKWAVEAFEKSFERAGKPMWEKRYKYANDYYSKFSSAGAGDVSMDDSAGGGFSMATSAEAAPSEGVPTTMNGWAYYDQNDSQWQEDINGKKIGPSGCGMTSHAMMLTTMFGKKVTPVTVGKWARANNYWNNGMDWQMPSAVAKKLGLQIVKSETNYNGLGSSALSNLKDTIKSGYPAIISGKGNSSNANSPFTGGGHIVLGVGVDGDGNVIINDPRGASKTKAYTDDGILNIGTGLRGYWAFDTTANANLPSDWSSGDYTAAPGSTVTPSGTTASVSVDPLGVFGKLQGIGTGLLASIYNGSDMFDAVMNPATGETPTQTPANSNTGSVQIDETLMYSGTDGFFKALSGAAMNTYNQYKNVFPSTILAQAACESAWGKSKVAQSDKNLFGIKWTGKHNPLITVSKGRNCPGNEQGGARPYNKYNSFGDSILDHGWFLNTMSPYKATLAATTPTDQIEKLGVSGYAEKSTYGKTLMSIYNKYDLNKYNPGNTDAGNGEGDGNTYLVSPKGDAGKGMGKVSYSKSSSSRTATIRPDANAQRELENINRKVNVAFNSINSSDPTAYAEVLKLIMQELRSINNNTAATAAGISEIEIVSANEPIRGEYQPNNTERYITQKQRNTNSKLQTINTSTGYNTARQIAGYKK